MAGKPWSNQEIEKLRDIYKTATNDQLLEYLPERSICSIGKKANSLGIVKDGGWTEGEIEILATLYPTGVASEELCALLPRRNLGTIRAKAKEMGITRNLAWLKREDELLRQAYEMMDTRELYGLFPKRTEMAITSRAKKLNLRRPVEKMVSRTVGRPGEFLSELSDFDMGYLAGLIDGEGHIGFSIDKKESCHMQIQIANTDRAMIDWLVSKVKGGRVYERPPSSNGHKKVYHWGLFGPRKARQFLSEIAPYLVVKKGIAEKLAQGYVHLNREERRELARFVRDFNRNGTHGI